MIDPKSQMLPLDDSSAELDPEFQIPPWADATKLDPESQPLAPANDHSLKRKWSELEDGTASEIDDSNKEVVMKAAENAYCDMDVEMVVEGESHSGESAVCLTTQVSFIRLR